MQGTHLVHSTITLASLTVFFFFFFEVGILLKPITYTDMYFVCFMFRGHIHNGSQGLLLALCIGVTPNSA